MYNPQPFGMDVGLGMGVEPPFAMGVAGGFDTMANYGGFDASVNADLGGGVGAGPYPTYAYQNSIDDRTAFATHAHFVQQQANVSIFPGFEFFSRLASACDCNANCLVPD